MVRGYLHKQAKAWSWMKTDRDRVIIVSRTTTSKDHRRQPSKLHPWEPIPSITRMEARSAWFQLLGLDQLNRRCKNLLWVLASPTSTSFQFLKGLAQRSKSCTSFTCWSRTTVCTWTLANTRALPTRRRFSKCHQWLNNSFRSSVFNMSGWLKML